jgi:glucose-1-phosphate thymidylyltransferase
MKGIVLAGGTGSRLRPLTISTSKQLLPVYNKPMIYYPISTLMLGGITDILIITTPHESDQFKRLLGDGSHWGICLNYAVQARPGGIAQALILGKEFISNEPVALILGDNIFFGPGLGKSLERMKDRPGATIFAYEVEDPRRYGVVQLDERGRPISIEEKPTEPKSKFAIPGLYFYDHTASNLAGELMPSERGELEITDLLKIYLDQGLLQVEVLGREKTWLDAGTIEALYEASSIVHTIEKSLGAKINIPEEVAWRMGYISSEQFGLLTEKNAHSEYGEYLKRLLDE